MKKKRGFGVNIGTSSIMLIFVILCLVSFATLSIVSAHVDYGLSKKLSERTQAYYQASNQGNEFLATLNSQLHETYLKSEDRESYYASVGESTSFSIELTPQQSLEIHVDILYPENPDTDPFLKVSSWQIVTYDNLELDDSLPVFTEEDFVF